MDTEKNYKSAFSAFISVPLVFKNELTRKTNFGVSRVCKSSRVIRQG